MANKHHIVEANKLVGLLLKPFLKKKQIRSKLRNKKSQATVFQYLSLLKFILEEKQKKNKKHMMYEVNKFSFEIKEAPNIRPLSNCYVQEMSPIRVRRKGKDTEWNYYAETKEEAEAKVAELKAAKIEKLKQEIEWHESQALYAKSRLMALISETEKTKQP